MPKTSARKARQVRGGAVSQASPGARRRDGSTSAITSPANSAVAVIEPPAKGRRIGRKTVAELPAVTEQVTKTSNGDAETDALWTEFRRVSQAKPSEKQEAKRRELRNRLIERFYEIVKFTAERMRVKLPSEVDVDDLMSAGLFGLMDAIEAFDPKRGVKFETYCAQRVRGAIVDELRSMDWVPRLVRSRTAKVERVRKQFEMQTGRRPTEGEVAERMNVSAEEFSKLNKDSRPVGVVSLNRKFFETDSSRDVREIDVIEDIRQLNPNQLAQRGDLRTLLTRGLSRAERLILILYYEEEMTMKEIGATLDLSESRVSQMHSSIIQRLKARMSHRLKDD
ncbi:MAG: FliA/WhiG family RNA polymerase sigma factor [Phycisphaeraceae bacterium]|nr:FliA/WhiG family RNA polymerase sigma factor [Phycisphaeraceae bacterium]